MRAGPTIAVAILAVAMLAGKPVAGPERPHQELLEHFQRGNKAYVNDKDYERAIEEYNKVLAGGVRHPDLTFSLANAYYLAGRKGLAVLYYEKTLMLDPSYEKAASNLGIVRKELIDRVVMPDSGAVGEPAWHGFLRGISPGWLTWTFLSLYLLGNAVLVLRRLRIRELVRRLLFWLNVPVLSLTLVFGLLLAARIYVQERVQHGVVITGTASMLEGPERFAKELMEVHEGLKVRLLNEVGDYVRVRLANGVEGFIRDSQIGRI